jgi:hypothetical protein
MNVKSKAAIVFVCIFAVGAAVGALAHRAVVHGHIRHIMRMRDAGLLVPWRGPVMDRVIGDQKKAVEKIFEDHGKRLADINAALRKDIDAEFASLWKDLEAVIPAEVMKKIKEETSHWPPPPPNRGPGGPEGGGGPGGPAMLWPGGPGAGPGGPGPGKEPPPPPEKPGEKKQGRNEFHMPVVQ